MTHPVIETLRSRRSIPRVRAERPPRELVEQVIAAAAWAPNHYHTEPWRFIVLAGDARGRLGDVLSESLSATMPDPASAECAPLVERERLKPLRAPVVIVTAVVRSENPKAIEVEEMAAAAAGVQNMLIAAHALGLAAMWRTGKPAYDAAVKRFLRLPEDAHIIAFVYLGYADIEVPERAERDSLRHARWVGWE